METTGNEHRPDTSPPPAGMSVMDAVIRRRSCRSYLPDPVPEEALMRMLEAARLAPSASNQQPWRFAVVRDPDIRRRIVEDGLLPGIRKGWALEAPVIIAIGMETSFLVHGVGAVVSSVNYPWIDIGIAGEHIALEAVELRIGTCWIGWIRPRVVARIVGWPRSVKTAAVMTAGYPREPDSPNPSGARRKPLGEIVRWV